MTIIDSPSIDRARLEAFVGQAVVDMGAAISGLLLHIGDRLGLYQAMAGTKPITSDTLAQHTGTTELHPRMAHNQAAGGDVVEAGFSQVLRATETPFNMVLEARP
jgi:hypothetical protein